MTQSFRFRSFAFAPRPASGGLLAPVMWLAGLTATVAALIVGAVLALFTAAAVAVIALCGGMLVFLAGLALKARRAMGGRNRRAGDVIEARKVGDTWVTYGWERQGR